MNDKIYNKPDSEIYSKEELAYFDAIEKGLEDGTTESISEEELLVVKEQYSQIATNTINKITRKKALNLRLYEDDILSIKSIALEKGLPYQTLIASILHQVATKQIDV